MQVLGSSVSLNGVASGQGFSHEGVAAAPSGRLDIVIGSGFLLRATVSGTSTISGSAAWTLVYEPLDPGAKVEAA